MMSPREELEVRLTAMLMGELSEAETAALQTEIANDPALAALYARLQRATALLREAVTIPEEAPLRLSDERRHRLLAHFRKPAPAPIVLKPRWKSAAPLALAASIAVLLGGGLFWINDHDWQKEGNTVSSLAQMEARTWSSQPGAVRSFNGKAEAYAYRENIGQDGAKADEFTKHKGARNLALGQLQEAGDPSSGVKLDALAPTTSTLTAGFGFGGGGSGAPPASMPSGSSAGRDLASASAANSYGISDAFSTAGKVDTESKIAAFDSSDFEGKPSQSTAGVPASMSGRMGRATRGEEPAQPSAPPSTALASNAPSPAAPNAAAPGPILGPAASDSRGFAQAADADPKLSELSQSVGLADVARRQLERSAAGNFGAQISSKTLAAEQSSTDTSGFLSPPSMPTPANDQREKSESLAESSKAGGLPNADRFAGGVTTATGALSTPGLQTQSGEFGNRFEAVKGLKEPATASPGEVPAADTKWLYARKDGSINGDKQATEENPIVGRMTFWDDDDSTKLDINTASEGMLWNEPGAVASSAGKQDTKAEINGMLGDAEGAFQSGRYGLAYKNSQKALAIDPSNNEAKKLQEKVDFARDNYADAAYNEARSRTWWKGNNGENPVTRFSNSAGVADQPGTADRATASLDQETLKPADENMLGKELKAPAREPLSREHLADAPSSPATPQTESESTVTLATRSKSMADSASVDKNNSQAAAGDVALQDGESTQEFSISLDSAPRPSIQTPQGNSSNSLAGGRGGISNPEVERVRGRYFVDADRVSAKESGAAPGAAGELIDSLAISERLLEQKTASLSDGLERQPEGKKKAEIALGRKQTAQDSHDLYFRESEVAEETRRAAPAPARPAAPGAQPPGNFDRGTSKHLDAAPAKPAAAAKPQQVEVKLKEAKAIEDSAPATPAKPAAVPQPEILTSANAFSTFSLNVSDVAFKLAGASLEQGKMPEPSTVRSEEFINAFDYRDPEPAPGAPIAFASERARYPFAQNRDLLRLSVKTAAAGRQPGRPLNLVLLLDNSGSMERADRVRILRESLTVLAKQLQPQDHLSIITFARTPRLWVDGVAGNQANEAIARVGEITPQGGTNLAAALELGYETALRHYQAGSISRVVLLTDGAANLGDVDPAALKQKVEVNRKKGVALDCFGIGWEGYNDDLLEQLSRNGDGRYGFINTPEQAATEFAGQLAGALRVAASDVKVQVEFNPRRVTAYRQVGYAKHQLTKQQFRDNTVDAAEIGAAESGNALYVVEVNPRGEGDLATVRVRFKVPGTSDYKEHEWAVPFTCAAPPFEQAAPSLRLAGTASAFSEWLAGSPFAAEVTSDRLLGYFNGIPSTYGADPRPPRLEWMIRQAKSISGR